MQFRLVYRGKLPAARWEEGTRRKEKHEIRKVLHKQLAELWKQNSLLSILTEKHDIDGEVLRSKADSIANNFTKCGFRFLPLVTQGLALACSLDILFLRRDAPGKIIQSGGDIDNRIKVLFDALRVPRGCDEVKGFTPDADEDPLYCLLEDDTLINDVRVNTDRLLLPMESGESEHDVMLIIHVRTIVTDPSKTWVGWGL